MFVGLVLGFVAGLYVAWNFWPQPAVVEQVVKTVHTKVGELAQKVNTKKDQ